MTRHWREHAEAFDEYRAAARWYDDRSEGLGDAFMDAVDAPVESILDPAIKWGFYRGRILTTDLLAQRRRVPLRRDLRRSR